MTLAQIARYLGVDEHAAHAALNRIGVLSPVEGEESTIILMRDLARASAEIEQRKKWANGVTQSRTT